MIPLNILMALNLLGSINLPMKISSVWLAIIVIGLVWAYCIDKPCKKQREVRKFNQNKNKENGQ